MGIISNPEFPLPGKDLNVSMEICKSVSHDQVIKKQEEGSVFPALTVKLQALLKKDIGIEDEDGEADGYKTPTAEENKIPMIFICPPAPRAPKSKPIKRKLNSTACRRNLMIVDFSGDIEGIFSRPADLGGITKKVKRT